MRKTFLSFLVNFFMACARLVGKDHFRHDESVDYNQKKMLKELCYIMTTHEREREER